MIENTTGPEKPIASERVAVKDKLEKYQGPYKTNWLKEQIRTKTNKKQEQGKGYADDKDRKHIRDNCQEVVQSLDSLGKVENLPPKATTEEFIELLNENGETHFANIGEKIAIPQADTPAKEYKINFICLVKKEEKDNFYYDYFNYEKNKKGGKAQFSSGENFFENGPVPLLPAIYILSETESS